MAEAPQKTVGPVFELGRRSFVSYRLFLSSVCEEVIPKCEYCYICLSPILCALGGYCFQLLLQAHWIRSKVFLSEQHEKGCRSRQHSGEIYPASILPGQYSDAVHSYFPKELNCLPINTVVTPLPSLSLCMEGPDTICGTTTNVNSSVERQCSSENIIEGMDLAEQLTVNTTVTALVCTDTIIIT